MFICCSNRPERASDLQVRFGAVLANDTDPDAVHANVSRVIPHPNYTDHSPTSSFPNDVGLLHLTRPISYTDTILPICLPSPDVSLDQFKVCVDTGFGKTSHDSNVHTFLNFFQSKFVTYKRNTKPMPVSFCNILACTKYACDINVINDRQRKQVSHFDDVSQNLLISSK